MYKFMGFNLNKSQGLLKHEMKTQGIKRAAFPPLVSLVPRLRNNIFPILSGLHLSVVRQDGKDVYRRR